MKAIVKMHGRMAGVLERDGNVFRFQYDKAYLKMQQATLSLSLPLRGEPYEFAGKLPPYFSGLCSEGWLRAVQCAQQGISPDDEFALLMNNGRDLAGAVTIEPFEED